RHAPAAAARDASRAKRAWRSWRQILARAQRPRASSSSHVLEDLYDPLRAACRPGNFGGGVSLLATHQPQQIDDSALGDDLDVIDLELVRLDESRLYLGGDQRVVAARAKFGDRADDELILDCTHLRRRARNLADVRLRALGGHLAGQQ